MWDGRLLFVAVLGTLAVLRLQAEVFLEAREENLAEHTNNRGSPGRATSGLREGVAATERDAAGGVRLAAPLRQPQRVP